MNLNEEDKLENQFSVVQNLKVAEREMILKDIEAEETKADESEIEKMKE